MKTAYSEERGRVYDQLVRECMYSFGGVLNCVPITGGGGVLNCP